MIYLVRRALKAAILSITSIVLLDNWGPPGDGGRLWNSGGVLGTAEDSGMRSRRVRTLKAPS
jgi:hypothetical protein